MKDKASKTSKNQVGSEYHRKCHMAYTPRVAKSPKQAIQQNINNHHYIVVSEDSEQETSTPKKCNPQNEISVGSYEIQPEKSFLGPPEDQEREAAGYTDEDYYKIPVFVEPNKLALPIKKISFNLPPEHDEKKEKELDRIEEMDWNDYHKLSVIYKFMDDLEADFPSLCTTGIIGTSVEGRNLKILKISNSDASNAGVWMDAGIHAREWIAPAVNTYIANYITRNFETLPESIKNKDWYFLPVVNPDGYEYSHTTDRMWRKNRAYHGSQCVGVDLNRNFSIGWGGKGSSDLPNNAFYRGPQPFSEPESSAIRDIFLKSGIKFKVYITLHSYGQIIIFPYACTSDLAPDYVRLLEGATAMSKAIYDTNGNTYKVGISRDVMYGASGTSNDFAHGAAGIPYCYLIELRSKKHKFKLPKEEIEGTGNEILNCIKALMEFVDTHTYTERTGDSDLGDSVIKKTDSLVNCNTAVPGSLSYIHRGDSNIRKRDSYDKQAYSYAKKTDSYIKNNNSYVRWSHLPRKRTDLSENTGDTWNTNPEDIVERGTSPGNVSENSFEKPNSFKDRSDSFLDKNDSFMKQTECFKNASDSFFQENGYLVKIDDSYEKQHDLLFKTDAFVEADTDQRNFKLNPVKVAPPIPNTQVWEVRFSREGQRHFVKALDTIGAINIWKEERSTMDIMVDGPRLAQVAGMLHEREIPYSIAIPDISTMIEREQGITHSRTVQRSTAVFRKTMNWTSYHRLDTIYGFLDSLVEEYPYLCSVSVIGKSVEGRDLKMLKISNGQETNESVWLDGAIHPREWISPAVVTYIADRIVRTFNEQPESVTNKDWYILPVMNPDGYEYTHTHDRMWRKNRARFGECIGVDLNRNFSFGFGEKGEEGSSDDPGNVFYRGPKSFSEPETAAVRRVILERPTKFKVFLSFHSYGEVIIFPWGYTSEPCPDYVELLEGGTAMAKAIYNTNGHTYKVGSTKDLMYYAAGTSIDWSYGAANIPYSYMVELRGKTHRFLLPKEEIVPTSNEVLNGVFRLMDFVDRRCAGTQSCACPK